MVLLPVAIGRSLEAKPGPIFRRLNLALGIGAATVLAGVVAASLARDASWYERNWPGASVHDLVETAAAPDERVYAATRYGDWLLWKEPALRGRVAYNVRFEILDPETFFRIAYFRVERGENWKTLADGYEVVVLESDQEPSNVDDFLGEPGARALYRDDRVTVVKRRAQSM
jgi:hypothetical protein